MSAAYNKHAINVWEKIADTIDSKVSLKFGEAAITDMDRIVRQIMENSAQISEDQDEDTIIDLNQR